MVEKVKRGLGAAPERRSVGNNEGSEIAQRASARLAAVQVLYQMRLNNQEARAALEEFISHRIGFTLDGDVFVPADVETLREIVNGAVERWADVEEILSKALDKGEVEVLLECILRAGITELVARASVDTGIIINDYLNVTTSFYEGGETKLVNAVLDKVAKSVRE